MGAFFDLEFGQAIIHDLKLFFDHSLEFLQIRMLANPPHYERMGGYYYTALTAMMKKSANLLPYFLFLLLCSPLPNSQLTKITKDYGGVGLNFTDWQSIANLGKDISQDLLNTKPFRRVIE